MENYDEFLNRINSFEKTKIDFGRTYFTGNRSIAHKVDRDNTFKNFYGDTVVFDLDKATKAVISLLVDSLYEATPQCFCERLVSDTFHMTLHDLSNSDVLQNISDEMFYNELKIIKAKNQIEKLGNHRIRMKSNAIFNMVNTSLVLGLYPIDGNNYIKLMELYSIINDIKPLNYPLTPHITLAYYNVNGFDLSSASILISEVEKHNNNIDFEINLGDLYYQKFTNMNNYINIVRLNR